MRHYQPKLSLVLATAGLLFLAACGGDDPMDPDHDDHAGEVEGVTLSLSGQTVASYDGDSGAWTGELEVEPGEETAHISVQFVDHDGHAVTRTSPSPSSSRIRPANSGDTCTAWPRATPRSPSASCTAPSGRDTRTSSPHPSTCTCTSTRHHHGDG